MNYKAAWAIAVMTCMASCSTPDHSKHIPTEDEMGAYVMVYHKDIDHGLHMALSYDGYTWTSLNNDQPVISGDTVASQHGIRDPHIFRAPNGSFYLAMTDLHIFSQKDVASRIGIKEISEYRESQFERDDEQYGWGNNKGLVLMKSDDLVHWTRTNLDFTTLTCPTRFVDAEGNDLPWSEAGCVWAPETVYDYEAGHLLVHFTTRMQRNLERIYYVYMNDDFTEMLSEPKTLFQAPADSTGRPRYTVIDSDIIHVGDKYHLFYVSHEHAATVKHASSDNILGPYVQDDKYDDHDPEIHEAPNCWKRLGQQKWVIMYDNYHRHPANFGFVETSDFESFTPLGYFDEDSVCMKRTNFSEQKHAAVAHLTVDEAKALEAYWK
ncbi:MAG: glycoside hydrolase family 43 protein [Bacteroidales bacterium]|nr:glycoside hydrolase family 43 protein [Bacteroidales bacterium]